MYRRNQNAKPSVDRTCKERGRRWRANNRDKINEYKVQKYNNIHCRNEMRLRTTKHRAKRKNLEYDLDIEWFENEYKKGCTLSGLAFVEYEYKPGERSAPKNMFTVSVDRIDSSKGYTKDNCQLILSSINQFKGKFNMDDVLFISQKLLDNNRK